MPDRDEEEELELPPLDGLAGDEEEGRERSPDDDEIAEEPLLGEDEGSGLDLDPAAELDAFDDDHGAGADEALAPVDIGSLADAIALPDEGVRGSDERGLAHEEEEASAFEGQSSDEAGTGTGEDLAGFLDESALPSLGADDEADGVLAVDAVAGGRAAPWRGRYRVANALGAEVPCGLLAVSASHVVAAGPGVLVVRGVARATRGSGPDIDAGALAATDETIFAASRRGALFASADGGDTWTAVGAPSPASPLPISLAATPGRLWICQMGALWSLRGWESGRPEPQVLVRKEGVRAMVATGSTLVVLAERSGEQEPGSRRPESQPPPREPTTAAPPFFIERLRGDDEASPAEALPGAASAAAAEGAPILAATAGGRAVALCAGGAAHVSRDGGRSFRRSETGPALAAAFAGAGEDAPLMVLVPGERRAAEAAHLLEIDERGGRARVAEIAGVACGPAALAWDPARDVLWVACEAGLLAFERSAQH